MKIITNGFALLFFVFAVIQLNDPDPLYWILVYGGTSAILIARGFGKRNQFWTGVCVGVVLAGVISTAPSFTQYVSSDTFLSILSNMQDQNYVENSREFIGLVISLIVLAVHAITRSN
ncbi:MAG: transmembrane 220 family protein [Gammaproteobacteria bacterium]|nr:transmembrane 220 family protein [Gammaproteobacteria bacterium]